MYKYMYTEGQVSTQTTTNWQNVMYTVYMYFWYFPLLNFVIQSQYLEKTANCR